MTRSNVSSNGVNVTGKTGSTSTLYSRGGGLHFAYGKMTLEWSNISFNSVGIRGSSASQAVSAGGGGLSLTSWSQIYMKANLLEGNMARQMTPALAGADTYARGGGALVLDNAYLHGVTTPGCTFVNNRVSSPTSMSGGAACVMTNGMLNFATAKVVEYTEVWPENTVVNTVFTAPTSAPTRGPTSAPSRAPTAPTMAPSRAPTGMPTVFPTLAPSLSPSTLPTWAPTAAPTTPPTPNPTLVRVNTHTPY
jgi:hypothetical protein